MCWHRSHAIPSVSIGMLASRYRLRLNADFQRVRHEGKTWAHRLIVLSAAPNQREYSRFGFAVSRRVGKAVVRNRVRRRMREVVRLKRQTIRAGWDVVFVARPSAAQATYVQIEQAIDDLVRRAGLRQETDEKEQSNGVGRK